MANYGAIESGLEDRVLQISVPTDSPTVEAFVGHLCSRLRVDKYGLYVKIVTDPNHVSPNAPLVVICHNYSRIGTDIDTATSGLQGVDPKMVAVVVLHVKQKFALGPTMPADNISGDRYLQFGALVDYAFTPEDKIYSCGMNKRGDEKMQAFLQRFNQRSISPSYRYYCKMAVVFFVTVVILLHLIILALYVVCLFDNPSSGCSPF